MSNMIINKFKEHVKGQPEKIILETKERSFTYSELNNYANGISKSMISQYCGRTDQTVALLFDSVPEMIMAKLAALQAGIMYIPLDATYPEKRLAYMLQHADARLLVTNKSNRVLAESLLEQSPEEIFVIDIDAIDFSIAHAEIQRQVEPDTPAYLLYTSGSTGQPKGVIKTYGNLDHSISNFSSVLGIKATDGLTLFSSLSHEAGVKDIFTALYTGATIYSLDIRKRFDISEVIKWLNQKKITIWHSIPTLYRYFVKRLPEGEVFPYLRYIVLGGELLNDRDLILCNKFFPQVSLVNLYGLTESSLNTLQIIRPDIPEAHIHLGQPVEEVEIKVVDETGEFITTPGTGEILIISKQVSLGYWKDKENTQKHFGYTPELGRFYRTGDLAQIMENGSVKLVGRKDFQVKIRGYRVEPGEVESCLLRLDEIKDAVVIIKKDSENNPYLCAFYVATKQFDSRELRQYLNQHIMEYMIPARFIQLPEIPLTISGKVDRKALINLPFDFLNKQNYQGATNELEARLVAIWEEILAVSHVGITDNFFELGGHSLKAISLTSQIFKYFNVRLSLTNIFELATIKALANYIQQAEKVEFLSIKPISKEEYYPVSSAQRRQYALNQLEEDSTGYNIPIVRLIVGKLDEDRLNKAFHNLIQRHESLRTFFTFKNGQPVQVITEQVDFTIQNLEVKHDINHTINTFVRPFDLTKAPLLRAGLISLDTEENLLILDMHHIVSDGTSMGIMIYELIQLYDGKELPEIQIQYKDFTLWQNQFLNSPLMQEQEGYWLDKFSGEIPVLELPLDNLRPSIQSFAGDSIYFKLSSEVSRKLKEFSITHGVTLYMSLLAVFNILLLKYTDDEDVIVGTPIAGRTHTDVRRVVGMFINTLPMRNFPEKQKTFLEFLMEVRENSLKAFENQDYQFEKIVEQLNLRRDLSRNPLFDVLFALQNVDIPDISSMSLQVKRYEYANHIAKFDLSLYAYEEDQLFFKLEFCTDLFTRSIMHRFASHFQNIVTEVLEDPCQQIAEIECLTAEERQHLIFGLNDTRFDYPREKTLNDLFEAQVSLEPDAIAAQYKEESLSYSQLNAKSNQLARLLMEKGVGQGQIIALMTKRSLEMLIGIWGILKAGAAYLPIDPDFPEERIRYMLDDIGVELLLTYGVEQVEDLFFGELIDLRDCARLEQAKTNLQKVNQSTDLAYVIYTSGSTGRPKGILIEHRSVHNFIEGMAQKIDFTAGKTILSVTTLSFDIFVLETILAQVKGLKVVLASEEEVQDPQLLSRLMIERHVQMVQMTPSRMRLLLNSGVGLGALANISEIIIGGEEFPIDLLKSLQKHSPAKIYNVYGPTEATVWSTVKEITDLSQLNIGTPIANTSIYILNDKNKLQPVGVVGELCISGEGLARGYWNRDKLTQNKFIANPFEPSGRIYKTGDLARRLADGDIEFVGRLDHQVKIRGYRIELGEIENQILQYPDLQEVAVIPRKDETGVSYLCAYIVSSKKISLTEIRKFLNIQLPEYMIPANFINIEAMPKTPNGKIDRKALLKIIGTQSSGIECVPPTSVIEEALVQIWEKVLKVERVGIHDNFFDLGGHSLRAIAVTARIFEEFNVIIPLSEIFVKPTISLLAKVIEKARVNSYYSEIKPIGTQPYYSLSKAQWRLWAINQFNPDSTNYNIPLAKLITGMLDKRKLSEAFKKIVERHEAFRSYFTFADNKPVQKIAEIDFEIIESEASGEEINDLIDKFIRPFNLSIAPLIRVELVKLAENSHLLLMDMHHIISDRSSLKIILEEVSQLYSGKTLPTLEIQYKDFANWQNTILESEKMQEQEEYWLELFSEQIPVLDIPTDYQRPEVQSFQGEMVKFSLDEKLFVQIEELIKESQVTLFMALLAIYNIMLARYAQQEDIVVGAALTERRHISIENVVGMFINSLAIRNQPERSKTFKRFLAEVKTNVLKTYEYQDYPVEALIDKLNIRRDLSRNPLYQTMFSLQNIDLGELKLDQLQVQSYEIKNQTAKLDLTLLAFEKGNTLEFTLEYCTELFSSKTAQEMTANFCNIVQQVIANPEITIAEIQLTGAHIKDSVLTLGLKAQSPEYDGGDFVF